MTQGPDRFADVIASWLETAPAEEDVDSVLARIVAEVDDTDQQGSWWPTWATFDSNMVVGFGLGAAATILVAVIGAQLLGGPGRGGGSGPTEPAGSPAQSPSPTATSDPNECPYHGPGSVVESTPTAAMRGLIGLPAEGAVPSAPEHGRLVDCWSVAGGRLPYRGMVRLYDDGRLIWNYYSPSTNPNGTTGHIEQRLTAAGVALVMGEGDIGARDPLRLGDWLPEGAWEDETMRPYVPSGYGACLIATDHPRTDPAATELSITLTEKLALLPPSVADMLSDSARARRFDESYGDDAHCQYVSLAEARLLDRELSRLGFAQDKDVNRFLLQYHMDVDGDGPGTTVIDIWFEPVFPDGTIGCSFCG